MKRSDRQWYESSHKEIMADRRIVLVGKTGSGKSSLANTIFGDFGQSGQFRASCSSVSVTEECELGQKEMNGKIITLFDTPGYYDTEQAKKKLKAKIMESLKKCAPGPHAFLLVFKVERFTKQEEDVLNEMLECFSKEAFKYTTVVFTHGDQLDKGLKIKDWASKNDALKNLIQKCGGRVHVVDNKYWNNSQDEYRNNQYQVRELLKTIDQTVENGGYYTNGFWQQIKNIKILGIPLHVLLGFILGGVTFGAVGAGVAVYAGVTASGVTATAIASGLGGGLAGAGGVMALDPEAKEAVKGVASDIMSKVRSRMQALQLEKNRLKMD